MVLLQKKTILFQGSRGGSNIFQGGGVQFFPGRGGGGVQMLISTETHITCDFPGGGGGGGRGSGTPIPLSGYALETFEKRQLSKRQKIGFKTNYRLRAFISVHERSFAD